MVCHYPPTSPMTLLPDVNSFDFDSKPLCQPKD